MADLFATSRNFIVAGVTLGILAGGAACYISRQEKQEVSLQQIRGKSSSIAQYTEMAKSRFAQAKVRPMVTDVAPADTWIARNKVDGKKVDGGKVPRYTPIFFAPKLYLVALDDSRVVVKDLMAFESPDRPNTDDRLHKEVPNEWFFFYGLDDVIGDSDALTQDNDKDGFTNQEEHDAGTDPTNPKSHPPFALNGGVKMVCPKPPTVSTHTLELSSLFASMPDDFVLTVYKCAPQDTGNSAYRSEAVRFRNLKEGLSFGLTADKTIGAESKTRFRIVSTSGKDEKGPYAEIEDTVTKVESAKKFQLRPGSKPDVMRRVDDAQVTFVVTAGVEKGKEIQNIQVGQTFSIPGFENTECTLIEAKRDKVVVKVGEKTYNVEVKNAKKGKK